MLLRGVTVTEKGDVSERGNNILKINLYKKRVSTNDVISVRSCILIQFISITVKVVNTKANRT